MSFNQIKESADELLKNFEVFAKENLPSYKNVNVFSTLNTTAPFFDFITLAIFLGLTPQELSAIVTTGCDNCYKTFFIDKKTHKVVPYNYPGKLREINAPCQELKTLQKLLIPVFENFPIHPANNGFVSGKNIMDAVTAVKDGEVLIHVDLNKFFDNHKKNYVKEKLKEKFYITYNIELDELTLDTLIALLSRKDKLPQGAPTSPSLVVSLNYDMDKVITELASKYNLVYSRYADDLSFSGQIEYQTARKFVKDLSKIIVPFSINYEKLKIMKTSAKSILNFIEFKKEKFTKEDINNINKVCTEVFGKLVSHKEFHSSYIVVTENMDKFTRNEIETNLQTIREKLSFISGMNIKPHFYYIQSTKHLLGVNIVDGKINYPRKDYENLRMIALLLGRQCLLHKVMDSLVSANSSSASSIFENYRANRQKEKFISLLQMFSDMGIHNIGHNSQYRNLLISPLDEDKFNGILSHLHNVDKHKEAKLKTIKIESYLRCKQQLLNFIAKIDNFGLVQVFDNIFHN